MIATYSVTSAHGRNEFADPSRLEAVKWLAVVAMVVDHVGLFLAPEVRWLHEVGRFAMPAFALAFGIGMAQSRDPLAAVLRLTVPALIAEIAFRVAVPGVPSNVLVLFMLAALVAKLVELLGGVIGAVIAAGVFVCLWFWPVIDYGALGWALVVGGYVAARGHRIAAYVASGLFLGVLPSVGAFLGMLAVLVVLPWRVVLPRVPGLLGWVYAGHLALLAAVAVAWGAR